VRIINIDVPPPVIAAAKALTVYQDRLHALICDLDVDLNDSDRHVLERRIELARHKLSDFLMDNLREADII